MMEVKGSIFTEYSLDRSKVKWDEFLNVLTPVQQIGQMYFKREDFFAPLGYGGINGSKLRQAILLVKDYTDKGGKGIVISGASVKSPQLPMGTAVATHFGLDSLHVIGATKESTAMNHENVKMATWFGAKFKIIKVGYNPCLQSEVRNIISTPKSDYYYLNYGITTDKDCGVNDLVKFHMLGAAQTENIPDHIQNLIIPAGSCNSCTSVLLGLMLNPPQNLMNIHLIGISPSKLGFMWNRLKKMGEAMDINLLNFNKQFQNDDFICNPDGDAFNLYYHDLHGTGFTTYQDEMKFHYGGIDFHPTYEGKCMSYIALEHSYLISDKTLFWIIGSKPTIASMQNSMKDELGAVPTKISING
jgi:hypothetical protein